MTQTSQLPSSTTPKTVADLMAAAEQATGLSDFGDTQFLEGLEILVSGFNKEAKLSPLGEELAFGGLLNSLINRLRYVRDVHAHPEILQEKIEKPIVVLGLPRTGTTKLQRVLSAAPQTQGMIYWKMMNPAPFPSEQAGNPKERIAAAQEVVEMFAHNFPGFMARHPTEALQADEEVLLMQGSFQCVVTWMFARMPSFYEFAMSIDQRPSYQFLFEQMQYLQWQDGGRRGRPWVLKSPCHTGLLDTLLSVFPDAVLVNCHRDVTSIIPSMSGLMEEMRRIHSDSVDSQVIGPELLDYFGCSMDRYLKIRSQLPSGRIMDVRYEDVLSKAPELVQQIFAAADIEFNQDSLAAIHAFEAERPQHQFGTYSYSCADYGVSPDMINTRFAEYQRQFSAFITH
jgi:hypothetical protein